MFVGAAGPDAPIAVGAYIFAGGFTIGVSKYFRVLAHLEESQYGVKTSQHNFPGLRAYTHPTHWPLEDLRARHDIKLVYCNPPCALFSQAGATMRGGGDAWKTDPRQKCWRNCFVAFEAMQPDCFVIESVQRAYTAGRAFVDDFAGMAVDMGYHATHLFVDARNYGMAQRRKRYFLVLHKMPLDFTLPDAPLPTVNELLDGMTGGPGHVLPWKNPTHEALIPYLRSGESFRDQWEAMYPDHHLGERNAQGGVLGRPRIFIHRVNGDGLIGTITGDYFVHPTGDHLLGMNELKVLNGFPEEYWLEGNPKSHASLISRGVCPNVAEWLAMTFRKGIDNPQPWPRESQAITFLDLSERRPDDHRIS